MCAKLGSSWLALADHPKWKVLCLHCVPALPKGYQVGVIPHYDRVFPGSTHAELPSRSFIVSIAETPSDTHSIQNLVTGIRPLFLRLDEEHNPLAGWHGSHGCFQAVLETVQRPLIRVNEREKQRGGDAGCQQLRPGTTNRHRHNTN